MVNYGKSSNRSIEKNRKLSKSLKIIQNRLKQAEASRSKAFRYSVNMDGVHRKYF